MANPAIPPLLEARSPDGGWGAYPDLPGRTETTALATLALFRDAAVTSSEASSRAGREAADWLTARQLDSGAWPIGDDVPGPSWTTSIASLALSHAPDGPEADARTNGAAGAAWLLTQEGRGSPWWLRVLRLFLRRPATVALDPDLVGWPWVAGTFSWVEPTSYALLALKRFRPRGMARSAARIEEAERLLLDRTCADGGWNYGNTRVFDEELWSYPDTTAIALLALGDRPEHPVVPRALAALEKGMLGNDSHLALGLAAAALATHGRDPEALRDRLRARLAEWRGGAIRGLAWAALGLSGDDPLGVRRA
ncbi:MAG: hypothetical protein MJB57_17070 [Gemmatimonadetes bacterium]|nr:hypothetical protein [Gemmatimonadota bacterium]